MYGFGYMIDLYTYNKLIDSLQYNPSHDYSDERLYETVEDLTMSKYYDYEVEETEEEKPKTEVDWGSVIPGIIVYAFLIGLIIFAAIKVHNGG